MQVIQFVQNLFLEIWNMLFNTTTPFGVSIGVIIFGTTLIGILMNFTIMALGFSSSDFSSLGSPKDYYRNHREKRQKERAEYARAEARFRSKHNGQLAEVVKK